MTSNAESVSMSDCHVNFYCQFDIVSTIDVTESSVQRCQVDRYLPKAL